MEKRELNENYRKIGTQLIAKMPELAYIRESKVKIAFLQSDYEKKSNGKLVFAECEKVQDKNKWALQADFTITLYQKNIGLFSDRQISILIFHELLHVGISERTTGEVAYSIIPHDVEDFKLIIEKFGVDWSEV